MTTPHYGWLPDKPDQRDYLYSAVKPRVRLPKKVDLREACSAVEQQGKLGSCTANALAGNIEFLDKKLDGEWAAHGAWMGISRCRLSMWSVLPEISGR